MTVLTSIQDGDMSRAISGALKAHWRLLLFQGVAMVILGVLAVAVPAAATVVIEIYVGWLFLISGVVGLVAVFAAGSLPAFLWSLVTAALSVVAGILLLWKPAEGVVSLTLVLTAFFVAEGIFQIVASIAYRDVIARSWGWMLLSGVADLALAAVIILGWPMTAAWVVGLIVGVNLITSGFAVVMAALAGRDVTDAVIGVGGRD
jgi:uncharacterized membrane protein HdeD (DUF308 family)